MLTEIAARLAGVGVDGVELGVHRADVDNLLALHSTLHILGLPVGYAAVLQVRLRQRFEHRVGVELPFLFSGTRIERYDPVERSADIQGFVDKQRRRGPNAHWLLASTVRDV